MTTPTSTTAAKVCDNASVGVLVFDPAGRLLLIERATPPAGLAPPAGHVFDDHDSYEQAAHAEVREELGLTVVHLRRLPIGGWRPNRCRRHPGPAGTGHRWQLYRATVTGDLAPSAREVRAVRWADPAQLQRLADHTTAHAHGHLTAADFQTTPGLEPVWVQWLSDADLICVDPSDLTAIDQLAAGGQR